MQKQSSIILRDIICYKSRNGTHVSIGMSSISRFCANKLLHCICQRVSAVHNATSKENYNIRALYKKCTMKIKKDCEKERN